MPPLVPAMVNASVPLEVIGLPLTLMMPPVKVCATLLTVPGGTDQVPSPRKNVVLLGVPVTGFAPKFVTLLIT